MPKGLFIKIGDQPSERFIGAHRVRPGTKFKSDHPALFAPNVLPDDIEMIRLLSGEEQTDDEATMELIGSRAKPMDEATEALIAGKGRKAASARTAKTPPPEI